MATKLSIKDRLEQRRIKKAADTLREAGIQLPALGPVTAAEIRLAQEEADKEAKGS